MYIKSLGEENKFDVFLGNGWLNFLRVQVQGNKIEVLSKADHVDVTDKLKELVFFKIKRYQRN